MRHNTESRESNRPTPTDGLAALLAGEGVSAEQFQRAVNEDRLGDLIAETVLGTPGDLTETELCELSGVDVEFVRRWFAALGIPRSPGNECAYDQTDLDAVKQLRHYLDLGLPRDGMLLLARTMGLGLARVAEASATLVSEAMLSAADSDPGVVPRYASEARALAELEAPVLAYVLKLHLRQLIQSQLVVEAERHAGSLEGGRLVAVSFVDLVGFTRLGEEIGLQELGLVADRLTAAAFSSIKPPVSLVKTIGDAVMVVSADAEALLDATLDIVSSMEREALQARAGVAFGRALGRGGDWFGGPVNIASRVTHAARSGSVLATSDLRHEVAGDGYEWSQLPPRRFKGLQGRYDLWRVRHGTRHGTGEDNDAQSAL